MNALLRRLRTLGGWLLGLAAAPGLTLAANPVFLLPDFTVADRLALQGHASPVMSRLRLTSDGPTQTGGVWYGHRLFLTGGFETVFQVQVSESGGPSDAVAGEGFAFVIQNNGLPALGGGGDGLGYDGIPNSLAVEFDYRSSPARDDPGADHVSLHTRAAFPNSADHSASLATASNAIPALADGAVHTVKITWSAGVLRVFVDDLNAPLLTVALDLYETLSLDDGQAWVGFTAATSASFARHELLDWSFSTLESPLAVTLARPLTGASYLAPGRVTLEAEVTGTGAVSRVEFYDDARQLGAVSASPFQFNWNDVIPGTYTLQAAAVGEDGSRAWSLPVTISVLPGEPPIGINFASGAAGASFPLEMIEQAGTVAQRFWNNLASVNGDGAALNLRNGAGQVTSLDVSWNFAATAELPAAHPALSGNHALLRGYLADVGGAGGAASNSTVTVQQVPFPVYDVIVYSDGANGAVDRTAEFRLNNRSVFLRDAAGADFAGIFRQGNGTLDQGALTPEGNYARFNSLTNGAFTLTVTARSSAAGPPEAAVNALQIVPSINSVTPVQVTRGPYLQVGTPTSVLVRWRTDRPTTARVRYGLGPAALTGSVERATLTAEHVVQLPELRPGTRYYYAVGTLDTNLVGPADCFFVTPPPAPKPTRIWVLGDSGTANANAAAVRDAYYTLEDTEEIPADLWLMLGDNAYNRGTDAEFQAAVFNMYPRMLRQAVLWPTIGNHETSQSHSHNENIPYYQVFSFPTNAEAGGVPSGTKQYYSFDFSNVHFVCLDSMTSARTSEGPMYAWLQADLEANTNDWIIAFFHHPPYTKGSHDSDNLNDADVELVEMRENILPLLEAYGTDLVLSGHSHCYERSYPLYGHYGYSWQLQPEMIRDRTSGRPEETGPYRKFVNGPAAGLGTIYSVVGSSGQATFGSLDHPAMFVSYLQLGSMVIDIDGPTLRARWIRETGVIQDSFTIVKTSAADEFRITTLRTSPTEAVVTWESVPGRTYTVYRTVQLDQPDWERVSGNLTAETELSSFSHPLDAGEPTGFYRVRTPGDSGTLVPPPPTRK